MKNIILLLMLSTFLFSCNKKTKVIAFEKYDETSEIKLQQEHENERMRFKLIQSKYLDMNEVFKPFEEALSKFSEKDYLNLEPFLVEQDIPFIQEAIGNRILTYEKIALFYLYRIRKYESNKSTALHSIISLNPNIIKEARAKDRDTNKPLNFRETVYGLPILLKDNINTKNMRTTAGAVVLEENYTKNDAFIVKSIKDQGGLILGKVNLSEWAYYFCSGCPLGYSAIGGQTLNPYGRKVFETGGSSSGSGVSIAANYAVAAVGTETSGSILSPSSKNSVVGLKPTIGLLSRNGIVPISSTLDTPGPMTKNTIDNAILLNAMYGYDASDSSMKIDTNAVNYLTDLKSISMNGKRFAVFKDLLSDTLYNKAVEKIIIQGAEIVEINISTPKLNGFLTLLNIDMKNDLPNYLEEFASAEVEVNSIEQIIEFNKKDSVNRMPYNQALFDGILRDSTSSNAFTEIKKNLHNTGSQFLDSILKNNKVDAILSINNYHAGIAAVGKYPCLTVPMGYENNGEPKGLTFIGAPFSEKKLLQLGYAFEKATKHRILPKSYK